MNTTTAKQKQGRSAFDLVVERGIEWLIKLCGVSAILFVFGIVFFIVKEGWGAFSFLTPRNFIFNPRWDPMAHNFGIGALILGTLSVTALSMVIAVPFGLGAAVFVSEFCTGKMKESLKVIIELLAAIPSVVWGFVGVALLGPIIQKVFDANTGVNMLNASLLLALMSVPIMVSIGEDALKAVPDNYREAAHALGATKWQIIWRVLIPAAKNGLLAAVHLGVGRAIGETMAVLMATGHSARIPTSILDPVQTLTATIAADLGEARQGSEISQTLFLVGVLLFGITFIVNLSADLIVRGIKKK